MIVNLEKLKEIAEIEFHDIVKDFIIQGINDFRIILPDNSFVEVWYSLKLINRFSYHWERRHINGSIYRHDNATHKKWEYVSTFPKHFHDGHEERVVESDLEEDPERGLRNFLSFVKQKMAEIEKKG
ncbi:MAG: DUF6516 family protein [Candidatus Aminicenantes bacterium]